MCPAETDKNRLFRQILVSISLAHKRDFKVPKSKKFGFIIIIINRWK